ncbi:Phospholipase D delta [Hordeum vulgare]|nr:Phospholipase D delta [Hordeum vulgare]
MGEGSTADAEAPVHLYGDLEVWIAEARCLPNMDITSQRMRSCFTARAGSSRSSSRSKKKRLITSASYAYVSFCLSGGHQKVHDGGGHQKVFRRVHLSYPVVDLVGEINYG